MTSGGMGCGGFTDPNWEPILESVLLEPSAAMGLGSAVMQ